MSFTMSSVTDHFTPGQIARQAVIDHILSTTKQPYRFNVTIAADWVMHGGPSSYVDSLVEEDGEGLIGEVFAGFTEAAAQINEPEPEIEWDYGKAALHRINDEPWSTEAAGAQCSDFDSLVEDRGNWIALDINPDDFRPVEVERVFIDNNHPFGWSTPADHFDSCVPSGASEAGFCEVLVNPDDFKPVEDRPFEKGDRVIATSLPFYADDVLAIGSVGTVMDDWGCPLVEFDSGVRHDITGRHLAHLAPESKGFVKPTSVIGLANGL